MDEWKRRFNMFATLINDLLSVVLSTLIKFIIKWIIRPILWFSYYIVKATVVFYLYQVGVLLLTILDFVEDMFRMVAGLKQGVFINNLTNFFTGGSYAGTEYDLLFQLITSKEILEIFAGIFTVGVFMILVTTLMAVVKQELNLQKSNNKMMILKTSFRAMIYIILVPVITMFGVYISNSILGLVDTATGGGNTTVSGTVFASACYEAFYDDGDLEVWMTDPYTSAFSNVLSMIQDLFQDDDDKGKVDFSGGGTASGSGSNVIAYRNQILDAYRNIDQHNNSIAGAASGYRVYYNVGIVCKDFNGGKINYIVWYFFCIVLIKTYCSALFGLVERLYKAVLLFLVMPGMIGLMPLDEGQAFGTWRKQFISEVLGIFGTVIGMNLFLFMAPIAASLDIDYTPTNMINQEYYNSIGAGGRYNNLKKILLNRNITLNILAYDGFATLIIQNIFIMVGALMINKMSSTISSILGGGDVLASGAGMQGEFMKSAAGGARFGAAVTMGGLSATRFIAPRLKNMPRAIAGGTNAALGGIKNAATGSWSAIKNFGTGIKEGGFKGGMGVVKGGVKNVVSKVASTNAAQTLGDGIVNGAIFSPAAMKNLYIARNDERKAKADLDKATASGDAAAIEKAQAAYDEKHTALERKKVSTKGAGIVNMEMGLQMGKDALKDLIPGSGIYDKFKKNVDGARNDALGGNSIGSNLKDRIAQMKQDAADKKAEKKYADIYDSFGREGEGIAIDNVVEKLRQTYDEQKQYCDDYTQELEKVFAAQEANKINEADAKARIKAILDAAHAQKLDVTPGAQGKPPTIKPNIHTEEIKRLESLKSTSSKSEFDKQVRALISEWSKRQDKDYSTMVKTVEDGLEEVLNHMQSQNKKKKK